MRPERAIAMDVHSGNTAAKALRVVLVYGMIAAIAAVLVVTAVLLVRAGPMLVTSLAFVQAIIMASIVWRSRTVARAAKRRERRALVARLTHALHSRCANRAHASDV